MKRRHEIERKRLPKIQRDEIKAKSQQYRKSLKMTDKRVSVDIERELMKEVMKKHRHAERVRAIFRLEVCFEL